MGTAATLVRHLGRLIARPDNPDADAALVGEYARTGSPDAFAELVRRHGRMVLGVCQRTLADPHAADDAYQVTFIALARHARSLRRPAAVASWLYGVARHAALRQVRRRQPDQPPAEPSVSADPLADLSARELLTALDEELTQLPERYRLAVVLCHLEGRTTGEAARQLGTTPGTVRGWLARGRERLHDRLTSRGLTLSATLPVLAVTSVSGQLPALSAAPLPALAAAADAAARSVARPRLLLGLVVGLTLVAGTVVGLEWGLFTKSPEVSVKAEPAPKDDPLPPGAVVRLGDVRFKASAGLNGVACSPDGKFIAAGDDAGIVHVYDAATGREVKALSALQKEHERLSPVYSPDGRWLAAVSGGGQIAMWEAEGREPPCWVSEKFAAKVGGRVTFSPDSQTLAGPNDDGKVILWDPATGRESGTFDGKSVAFAPDGKTIATGGEKVRLWDAATFKELRAIEPGGDPVAWSPDGRTLAWLIPADFGSPDMARHSNRIVLWDVLTGTKRSEAETSRGLAPKLLVFTPDSKRLIGSEFNGTIAWDPTTGKEIPPSARWGEGLTLTPDGQTVVTTGAGGLGLQFFDLATNKEVQRFQGPTGFVNMIAWSPNGKVVAIGSDRQVLLYDPITGRLLRTLRASETQGLTAMVFAPDGRAIAVAAGHDHNVRLFDPDTGEVIRSVPTQADGRGGHVGALAYAPDGKRLAVASYGLVRLFDPTTGRQVLTLPETTSGPVDALAFTPDGKRLATTSHDTGIAVWDVESGNRSSAWPWHRDIKTLAFSPDGTRLAWGSADGWCQVWEASTGRTLTRIKAHVYNLDSLAWTPDGKRLVTTGGYQDRGPHVWDAVPGRELLRFRGHLAQSTAVAVSPDGTRAVSGGYDGQALVWDLTTRDPDLRPVPQPDRPSGKLPDGVLWVGPANGPVAWSADGRRLAAVVGTKGNDQDLAVWNRGAREPIWRVPVERDGATALYWTADGTTITAVGSMGKVGNLVRRDASTGKELGRLDGLPEGADLPLSPDGRTLPAHVVTMGKKEGANAVRTLMLIDATTGKRTPCTAARAAGGLAWSSDGKVLALAVTAADGKPMIRLSDATADKLIREWETPEAATRLIFTVDGRTILSQGQGGIHLWNATTGQLIREVRKAMGGGIEVRMSGDGTFIALKSFGGAVEVLDWEAERVLTNGDGVGNWYPFALAPDGTTLATAGDRGLLLWPVPGPTD